MGLTRVRVCAGVCVVCMSCMCDITQECMSAGVTRECRGAVCWGVVFLVETATLNTQHCDIRVLHRCS